MKTKKVEKLSDNNFSREEFPAEWVVEEVKSLRPYNAGNGFVYKEALQYLARTIEQDNPVYSLVLGLASFATSNRLSPLQCKKADEIIAYYEKKGVL